MAGNSIGIIRAFYRLGVRYVSEIHLSNHTFNYTYSNSSNSILSAVYSNTCVQQRLRG